jgi:hypothetical protein
MGSRGDPSGTYIRAAEGLGVRANMAWEACPGWTRAQIQA